MQTNNKGFTMVEMVIYLLVVSIISFFVFIIVTYFFTGITNNLQMQNFSKNYNNMITYWYSQNYEKWAFYSHNNNRLILYNSGTDLAQTGYIGYNCLSTGIAITNINSSGAKIDWNKFSNSFTGFECKQLSGWKVADGYWIGMQFYLIGRKMNLKFYFNENN